ncbi:MAG: ribonuclease P protein component [Armatimonadota bacterium]
MLPREKRLTKPEEFGQVFRRGKGFGNSILFIKVLKGRQNGVRVGVSVSKKFGRAVTRNRIKRILREAARRYINNIKPGHDLILVAKEGIREAKFEEILEGLHSLLSEAKLLCNGRPSAAPSSG